MTSTAEIVWTEDGAERRARWHSEAALPAPPRVVVADDRISADKAYRLACEGTALLWRGDFQNARQLVRALATRIDRSTGPGTAKPDAAEFPGAFHRYRMARAQRARTLGMLLIPIDAGHAIALRRAPDVRIACTEAYGNVDAPYVISLRELLGVIGAHEWRRKGVDVLGDGVRIHAHYGVFSPMRAEYVELAARAPLPKAKLAFDIGTGTGVLAALLARRGIERVVATDLDQAALACARENLSRLGLLDRVDVIGADLFPPEATGCADLIVCNPPWLPGKPTSRLEHSIYDPDSRMLKGFLAGLGARLSPGGEGWLILSDFAEHLRLRTRAELLAWFEACRLNVLGRLDARPRHPKVFDVVDALHAARQAEVTSLWRLGASTPVPMRRSGTPSVDAGQPAPDA